MFLVWFELSMCILRVKICVDEVRNLSAELFVRYIQNNILDRVH